MEEIKNGTYDIFTDALESENYDILYEGSADRVDVYDLTSNITDYQAIIVEFKMYHTASNTLYRQYEYIPYPEVTNNDKGYFHFVHTLSNGTRWSLNWFFSAPNVLNLSSVMKESSNYDIGITRVFGVKDVFEESDPTVPVWAKQPVKPVYTKEEIGLDNVDNTADYEKEVAFAQKSNRDANGAIIHNTYLKKTDFIETDPTVPAWAKQPTKPAYTKGEIGLSNVNNTADSTKHVAFAEKANRDANGAIIHDTYLQKANFIETDPTVPAWAKQSTKPTYTKDEVGLGNVDNTADSTKHVASAEKADRDANGAIIHDTYLQKVDFIETDPTVPAWAKQSTKPSYTKDEVGLGNVDNTADSTKHVASAEKANRDANGAIIHDTYLQKADFIETDPTVPAWAKQPTKPVYTKAEVGLSNVDNTADAQKHVAFAEKAAKDTNGLSIHDTYLKKADFTGKFNENVTRLKESDLLDSLAEITANDEAGKFAGAIPVKEINASLGGCSFEQEGDEFYIVGSDSIRRKLGFSRTMINLGSTSPINVSEFYDGDCSRLTEANFFIELKSVTAKFVDYQNSNSYTVSAPLSKTYNPATSVLNVSCTKTHAQPNIQTLTATGYWNAYLIL